MTPSFRSAADKPSAFGTTFSGAFDARGNAEAAVVSVVSLQTGGRSSTSPSAIWSPAAPTLMVVSSKSKPIGLSSFRKNFSCNHGRLTKLDLAPELDASRVFATRKPLPASDAGGENVSSAAHRSGEVGLPVVIPNPGMSSVVEEVVVAEGPLE